MSMTHVPCAPIVLFFDLSLESGALGCMFCPQLFQLHREKAKKKRG
jgi:hypothetical protein